MATEKEVFSALKMTLLNKSDSTENCTSPLTFQKKKKQGVKGEKGSKNEG